MPTFATPGEADIFCHKLNGDLQVKDVTTEDLPGTGQKETGDTVPEPGNITEETEQPETETVCKRQIIGVL